MNIEMLTNEKIVINMTSYLEESIIMWPTEIKTISISSANRNIFNIDHYSLFLKEIRANLHYSMIEKLLWIMERSRPDLELSIYFLMARVAEPIEEDWLKLEWVLKFSYKTKYDRRIISINDILTLLTYIDTRYDIYSNMRGHTGGLRSFELGIIHGKSSKQKINVKQLPRVKF